MQPLLILALALGALLPVFVAVVTVFFGMTRGNPASRSLAFAFGKGIGLGVAAGLTVSAVVVMLVLALAWLLGR